MANNFICMFFFEEAPKSMFPGQDNKQIQLLAPGKFVQPILRLFIIKKMKLCLKFRELLLYGNGLPEVMVIFGTWNLAYMNNMKFGVKFG